MMYELNYNINSYRQRVDEVLARLLDALDNQILSHNTLAEAIRYSTLLGGKRLRPYLVYTTGTMLGCTLECLDTPAAAIECIHAYSLIHDDLPAMDNDLLRRGHPTCHIRFDEATAILAGDALQALAFEILSTGTMPEVDDKTRIMMITKLATASGVKGMCMGQALDLAAEGKEMTLSRLEQVHRYKTGALIGAAIHLGVLTAGKNALPLLPFFNRYADAIGLAFQIQDDILDVVGESSKTGKTGGSDQTTGKSTYPALLGIDKARKKAWDLYQEALEALSGLAVYRLDTTPLEALAAYIIERDS